MSLRADSRRQSWASRMLTGPIVDAHIAGTVDDRAVLTVLPAASPVTAGFRLPDAEGLKMCSVDSTQTCPSTTWCQSTTACPSTTNCPSVQTCVMPNEVVQLQGAGMRAESKRLWPLAVS